MSNENVLEQMRFQMYKTISNADKIFKQLTPIEKLLFAQKAFIDANLYVSRMYSLDPHKTAFAFCVGKDAKAIANGMLRSVSCDLNFALNASPTDIYKTMIHENKHIQQQAQNTEVAQRGNKYRSVINKYPKSRLIWSLAPQEIDADNFAYDTLTKVMYQGLVKSEQKVQPALRLFKSVKTQINQRDHVIPVLNAVIGSPIKTIEQFFDKENKSSGCIRFFTFSDLKEIISQNPELFASGDYNSQQEECMLYALIDTRPHSAGKFYIDFRNENWTLSRGQQECAEIEEKLSLADEEDIMSMTTQDSKGAGHKQETSLNEESCIETVYSSASEKTDDNCLEDVASKKSSVVSSSLEDTKNFVPNEQLDNFEILQS